jgi:hypothetical protein
MTYHNIFMYLYKVDTYQHLYHRILYEQINKYIATFYAKLNLQNTDIKFNERLNDFVSCTITISIIPALSIPSNFTSQLTKTNFWYEIMRITI